jgi:hypothetical protein
MVVAAKIGQSAFGSNAVPEGIALGRIVIQAVGVYGLKRRLMPDYENVL